MADADVAFFSFVALADADGSKALSQVSAVIQTVQGINQASEGMV